MSITECTVQELKAALADGAPLLDVREPDEFAEFHIPGAVLVPLGQLPGRLADVPDGDPLYVVCRSGRRSQAGIEVLAEANRTCINVGGGSLAWRDAGFDVATGQA